jgi:hypothetical protein
MAGIMLIISPTPESQSDGKQNAKKNAYETEIVASFEARSGWCG